MELGLNITPEIITDLPNNGVFVFGSNLAGIHGAGAAALAHKKFGARWGQGLGFANLCGMGMSYAIATKDEWVDKTLPLWEILFQIKPFLHFAYSKPGWDFYVTAIGCGLAGYTPQDVAPLFLNLLAQAPYNELKNIYLPASFWACK